MFIDHNSSFGGRSWSQHPREFSDSLIHWSLRMLPQLENPMVKLVNTLGVFHSNRIQLLFGGSSQEVQSYIVEILKGIIGKTGLPGPEVSVQEFPGFRGTGDALDVTASVSINYQLDGRAADRLNFRSVSFNDC
ncbi:hypothetical protein MMC22_003847 [Lobaria immixta]|nr:hypothetical protein [Lobaria immixta]